MFTVSQFLKSDLLPWFKVLSDESILLEKPIEYVSVIELPVGDFIRKDELVLSTALGCNDNEDMMFELISGVHKAQACALILTNQADSLQLPSACVEYINKHRFPVILIPWDCRFADLIESVLSSIRSETAAETAFYVEVQKELLASYIRNEDISDAAQIIADNFHSECVICDADKDERGRSRSSAHRNNQIMESPVLDKAIEIKTIERLYGYLYLSTTEEINIVLFNQYLAPPLILWFDKEMVIYSAKQGEKDDFVWQLAKDSPDSDAYEELIKKGQLLGFNLLHRYTCIVGKIHLQASTSANDTEKWIVSNINSIKEEILTISSSIRKKVILTYQQERLILYIENTPSSIEQHINRFLDKLEEKFASVFPQILFTWGISEISNEQTNFHEYFLHAKLAQELCPQVITKNMRYSYEKTLTYNMLSVLSADEKIRKDSFGIIQPIIEYDRLNQSNLLQTLKVHLQLKNVSQSARSLHLHRQSLLYRINKIEELVGISLKDPDDAFLLEVCVRLYTKE